MTCRTLLTTALAIAGAVSVSLADDDIPLIHNTSPAEADTALYELEEVWRRGGFDDDVLIGWIADAIADDQGRCYLLDSQLYQIQVLDADGTPLDTFGREGEGPGEFTNPFGLCWWDDGVIAVAGGRLGALDIIDTTGEPVETLVLTDENGERIMLGFNGCRILGDAVLVAGNAGTGSAGGLRVEKTVCIQGRDGSRRAKVLEHIEEKPLTPFTLDEAKAVSPWSGFDTSCEFLYVAMERNRYEIDVVDADGRTRLRFSRDYETLERSEETIAELCAMAREQVAHFAPDAQVSYMDTYRDVERVRVSHDGNLWIANSRGLHTGRDDVICIYDVFDKDGHWLRCAELRNPHPQTTGGLMFLTGGRVLRRVLLDETGGVHDEDSEAETENGIICYRLIRRN